MKILFVSNHYAPRLEPNAKRIAGLAENLVKIGHDVSVITAFEQTEVEKIKGVNVVRKKTSGKFSKGKLSRLYNHISFFAKTVMYRKKKNSYDVIIATSPSPFNMLSAYSLSRYYKAKYVLDVRDVWPDVFVQTGVSTERSLTYKVFDYICNYAYKRSDAILTVSPRKVDLIKSKKHVDPTKVYYVSNGFDVDFLNQEINKSFEKEFNEKGRSINILYFGNVGIAQNLEPLIKALHSINRDDIMLHILGDGNRLNSLKEYASKIGFENIVYYGKRQSDSVFTALKLSDIVYVSLASDLLIDSIPTKIYESIALGKPTLLSASGDSADLLMESKIGISLPVKDSDQLGNVIVKLIRDADKYLSNSNYAQKYITQNYARNFITQKLDKILQGL